MSGIGPPLGSFHGAFTSAFPNQPQALAGAPAQYSVRLAEESVPEANGLFCIKYH